MFNECRIVSNLYRDSVALMQISTSITALPGVTQAYVVMATPANLELLTAAGLSGGEAGASSNDIVIAVQGQDLEVLQQAIQQA